MKAAIQAVIGMVILAAFCCGGCFVVVPWMGNSISTAVHDAQKAQEAYEKTPQGIAEKAARTDKLNGADKSVIETKAREEAKKAVLRNLEYPLDAEFYLFEWNVKFERDDRLVIVTGRVDAKNAIGGTHAYDFGTKFARDSIRWHCYYVQVGREILVDDSSNPKIKSILAGKPMPVANKAPTQPADADPDPMDKPRFKHKTGKVDFLDEEYRTWKSQDGKFSNEAVLIRFDQDTKLVTLLKKEGGEIEVLITALSIDDRNYIRQKAQEAPE